MTFLLDVNVLIALIDRRHVFHFRAHKWFEREGHRSWATCPTTQNGLVRIVGNPRYRNYPGPPGQVATVLAKLVELPGHTFWHDNISILDADLFDARMLSAPDQITDSYLLALSRSYGGRLATMDGRLSTASVIGGAEAAFHIPEA